MTKSEAFELAIVSVMDNTAMEAKTKIDVLEVLFDERSTAKILERREAANAAAS